MFTEEEGKKLISLARAAIEDAFLKRETDLKDYSSFSRKQGAFVTLNKEGHLRGCIGYTDAVYPLNQAIVLAARAAAFSDPRFHPLKRDEFTDVDIEVSVLSLPSLIRVRKPEEYLKEIKIGRDGLIIRAGPYSGLLLPEVAVEYKWDEEKFLRQLCMKAGLSMDAWQNVNYQIYRFSAEIFKEKKG